ncbi:hypothetical protein [Desulfurispira natronophila]|uniref:Lipoprotein n=1 Tax=Desulfurispira natronophila TaxID=682562 RepID=A0A7W8DHJ5_9BACT|nr:hypothetical protein [Desulfurispira natronophila]MBB5022353.1 hypothetical protein [Desulfurispira natronophila]
MRIGLPLVLIVLAITLLGGCRLEVQGSNFSLVITHFHVSGDPHHSYGPGSHFSLEAGYHLEGSSSGTAQVTTVLKSSSAVSASGAGGEYVISAYECHGISNGSSLACSSGAAVVCSLDPATDSDSLLVRCNGPDFSTTPRQTVVPSVRR